MVDLNEFELTDAFKAATLAAVAAADAKSKPKKRTKWHEHFTRVPRAWTLRLMGAHHACTYRLALYLLAEHRRIGNPIKLTNVALADEGVMSRQDKWKALRELERLELVTVERRVKKSPFVTVLRTKISGQSVAQ